MCNILLVSYFLHIKRGVGANIETTINSLCKALLQDGTTSYMLMPLRSCIQQSAPQGSSQKSKKRQSATSSSKAILYSSKKRKLQWSEEGRQHRGQQLRENTFPKVYIYIYKNKDAYVQYATISPSTKEPARKQCAQPFLLNTLSRLSLSTVKYLPH